MAQIQVLDDGRIKLADGRILKSPQEVAQALADAEARAEAAADGFRLEETSYNGKPTLTVHLGNVARPKVMAPKTWVALLAHADEIREKAQAMLKR